MLLSLCLLTPLTPPTPLSFTPCIVLDNVLATTVIPGPALPAPFDCSNLVLIGLCWRLLLLSMRRVLAQVPRYHDHRATTITTLP
jgi:hypothetical protein